jgi:hypothetical protein
MSKTVLIESTAPSAATSSPTTANTTDATSTAQ